MAVHNRYLEELGKELEPVESTPLNLGLRLICQPALFIHICGPDHVVQLFRPQSCNKKILRRKTMTKTKTQLRSINHNMILC
ncbi:hypothetical protein L2E82_06456 [Cichorium intybus]|uniref:Uncharacterized protein n=1 Tax=Cichorium intybus TaxID=13427 RepID=A0ACB9HB73_CICIN|nr:hypothetical protein L2E82_06456 [Cichorium intybus]